MKMLSRTGWGSSFGQVLDSLRREGEVLCGVLTFVS